MKKNSKQTAAGLLILCCFHLTGCQTLTTLTGDKSPVPPPGQDTFTLEVRPSYGKATRKQVPLTQDLWLQETLAMSNAKFRNKDVFIVRVSPKTGQKHKLSAVYDRTNRRVTMETDYAILPDDLVVIARDTTSSLERVMTNVLGRN